jgi:hypothetical protein
MLLSGINLFLGPHNSMSALLHDVCRVAEAAGDGSEGVVAALEDKKADFCRDPEVFRFLAHTGDDAPANLQCLWTAIRVYMAYCPQANVTGIGTVEEEWVVDSVWPRLNDRVPIVCDPPEDASGIPFELAVPEVHRGGPVRLAQVRRLLRRPEAPPFVKLTLNGAITYYVSLRPFKLARMDVEFLVPSVSMASFYWIAF